MSDKPRRWFQIHLSTAIVLMFVASALVWENIKMSMSWDAREFERNSTAHGFEITLEFSTGWPMKMATYKDVSYLTRETWKNDDESEPFIIENKALLQNPTFRQSLAYRTDRLIGNVLIGISILLFITFALERRIRRSEARKL